MHGIELIEPQNLDVNGFTRLKNNIDVQGLTKTLHNSRFTILKVNDPLEQLNFMYHSD